MGRGSRLPHSDVKTAFSYLKEREIGVEECSGRKPLMFPCAFKRRVSCSIRKGSRANSVQNKTMDAFPSRPKLLLDCALSRSAVKEIATVKALVFVVTRSGVCTVFNQDTLDTVAQLNLRRDESIRSLFYNQCDDSMLISATYRGDGYRSLVIRSTKVSDIEVGQHASCRYLFEAEYLGPESFVEFSEDAQVILTFNGASRYFLPPPRRLRAD